MAGVDESALFLNDIDEKDLDTLTLFQTSKELFVNDVQKLNYFSRENFDELKGLLADHDSTVAQLTLDTMTNAITQFGKEASDNFMDMGIPKLALNCGGGNGFTNISFYSSLKFISAFSRFHPEWICENIDEIQMFMLSVSFIGTEPNFVFHAFDIVDVVCDFKCELLLENECTILNELLKVLATEKVKALVTNEEATGSFDWNSFFSLKNAVEAQPMDKHVFLRCLKSLTFICDRLSKFQNKTVEAFFKKLADLLGKNSMKVINPEGSLHLLNVISEHHPIVARHICDNGILSAIKMGLCFDNSSVRRECASLLHRIAPYEPHIQAFQLLIDAVRSKISEDPVTNPYDENLGQSHLPPITAIAHAGKDAKASIILIVLGGVQAILELGKIKNKQVQIAVLDATVNISSHSSIHANAFAKNGGLSKIMKIDLCCRDDDLALSLANGFTKILLQTTHIPSVAACFTVCRYHTGRKCIQRHLATLLNSKGMPNLKKLAAEVASIDLNGASCDTKIKEISMKVMAAYKQLKRNRNK